jgi:hypothetical protein
VAALGAGLEVEHVERARWILGGSGTALLLASAKCATNATVLARHPPRDLLGRSPPRPRPEDAPLAA